MQTNPSWKDWFVFSKKERNAFVVLIFVIVAIFLTRLFYQPSANEILVENLDRKIATLAVPDDSVGLQPAITAEANSSAKQLFVFDPNILEEAGFTQLGLREKIIHTLINYRSKGGQFRTPEDIRKVYGLRKEEADRLMPFIRIGNNTAKNEDTKFKKFEQYSSYSNLKSQVIDINTATVEQWKALPAIGDALSNRIVKYRDKMGGFTSMEDVKKTYGLSDSAYEIIKPYLRISAKAVTDASNNLLSKKINLNTASASDLKSNPNIPSEVADAIIIYRKQHGNYSSVDDIKKIVFINEELYHKVAPYLTVE